MTVPGSPRYATPRDPARLSSGHRVAVVAQALGTPLMPWQRYVADVGTERNPDGTFAYPIVVVTVPRQSGKTTVMRAIGLERGMTFDHLGAWYTAQSGLHARERWHDLVKLLRSSPLRSQITVREAAGRERVIFPNGSEFRCWAPKPSALHGYTPPLVMMDEAWDYDEALGEALMGAIVPAQITIPHRQLWIVSTAGTARSVFLRKWIDAGLAGTPGVALIDYGFPDDVDPYDPDVWRTYHPAMGHIRPDGTPQITTDALADAATRNSRGEFMRAYGNMWTVVESVLIGAETFRALAIPDPGQVHARELVVSYDVAHDRSAATVVATWRIHIDGVDRTMGRILRHDSGDAWVADYVADLRRKSPPLAIAADDGGPTREVTDKLVTKHRLDVTVLSPREFAMATGSYLSAIRDGVIGHDGTTPMTDAASGVVTRPMADGIAFSRAKSTGVVSPVVAHAVGAWVLDHPPVSYGRPVVQFAS